MSKREPKDFFKWNLLSEEISGSDNSVRKEKVPKKYQKDIRNLMLLFEAWRKGLNS